MVDAARLTRAQLDTYLAALEQFAGAERAGAERVHFDAILAAAAVPEERLLHPPPEVVPTAKLAAKLQQVTEWQQENAAKGGGLKETQAKCQAIIYCLDKPEKCDVYKCWCNGVICV